ncbi:hypothetical protein N9F27_02765 [Crocinitomicaceae bacterium]|nr:hypothetical protein [Crocinitomicaceae bacterium]MDC1194095.1 hypothetical protein [Crocinitomicaceae bacterium]
MIIPGEVLNGTTLVIAQADVLEVNKITFEILDSQYASGVGNQLPNSIG